MNATEFLTMYHHCSRCCCPSPLIVCCVYGDVCLHAESTTIFYIFFYFGSPHKHLKPLIIITDMEVCFGLNGCITFRQKKNINFLLSMFVYVCECVSCFRIRVWTFSVKNPVAGNSFWISLNFFKKTLLFLSFNYLINYLISLI